MPMRVHSAIALIAAGIIAVTASSGDERACCAVLELRQYTLKPGQREILTALFDRHFIESQEALGMTIVGQFHDRRRPDRFVWIRGFSDMPSRHKALEQFYGGPVWAEHKAAANDTMVDVSDVCLLKPARPETAFHLDATLRPAVGEERKASLVVAGIHRLHQPADPSLVSRFEKQVVPELRRADVLVESIFVTESAPNTFVRLPVREGEHLLVWFGTVQRGEGPTAERLQEAGGSLGSLVDGPPNVLVLEATPRSLLGHHRAGR